MDEKQLRYSLEGIEKLYVKSYQLFKERGERAVQILDKGVEDSSMFAESEEIYQNSGKEILMNQNDFKKIVNLLSRAEVIPTWNSSAPFKILTEEYSSEDVVAAYEHVTDKEYDSLPENPLHKDLPNNLKNQSQTNEY